MPTNALILQFSNSLNKGASNVSRDATGALVGWMENGCYLSVARNPSANNAFLTLSVGSSRVTEAFWFDAASGRCIGTSGDHIPTVFSKEIMDGGPGGVALVRGKINAATGIVEASNFSMATRVATSGDQILSQELMDETVFDATIPRSSIITRSRGILALLNARLGHSLTPVYYNGVANALLSEIASRLPNVLAKKVDFLLESGGMQDVNLYTTLYASIDDCVAAVVAARVKTWQTAIAAGVGLIAAFDLLPVGPLETWNSARKQMLLRINRLLRDAAVNYPQVRVISASEDFTNFTDAGGLAYSGLFQDGRQLPSSAGASMIVVRMLKDPVIAALARPRPLVCSKLDSWFSDAANKNILNTTIGLCTGTPVAATGAGSSGVLPPSFSGVRSAGSFLTTEYSVVDAPSAIGKAVKAVMTNGNGGNQMKLTIAATGVNSTLLPPGSRCYFECAVDIAGLGITAVTGGISVTFNGSAYVSPLTSLCMSASLTDTNMAIGEEKLILVTPPVWLPDTATFQGLAASVWFTFGSAGAATAHIYQMSIIRL